MFGQICLHDPTTSCACAPSLFVLGRWPLHYTPAQWREKEGERVLLSGGNLFQVEGCPYALSREQADQVLNDGSQGGNTITLTAPLIGERGKQEASDGR